MKLMKLICLLFLSGLWLSCSTSEKISGEGGSATETVAFKGSVEYPVSVAPGKKLSGIRVSLRGVNYLKDTAGLPLSMKTAAPSVLDTVTDSLGYFCFKTIENGDYFLEINDDSGYSWLLEISVLSNAPDTAPLIVLQESGHLEGKVSFEGVAAVPTNVQIYGMERATSVDSIGRYAFEGMPAGNYIVRITPRSPGLLTVEAGDVIVSSADTQSVGHLVVSGTGVTWRDSSIIILNTTPSGADIVGNVLEYPLLIRLNQGNFDFSKSTGSDLRFAKTDGSELPFEVERWDAAAGLAEIWVKLDTVYGNSSTQSFCMFWGETSNSGSSDGPSVFSLSNQFVGVWHLGTVVSGVGAVGVYPNSVEDANHGTDFITSGGNGGVIGSGNTFDWGDRIVVPNATARLKPLRSLTLSSWVKTDTSDTMGSAVITMGDDYGFHVHNNGAARVFIADSSGPGDYFLMSSSPITDNGWHHCAGVLNDSILQVYVDGQLAGERTYPLGSISYNLGPDFKFGEHGTDKAGFLFRGSIDEVRILSSAKSPAWIELDFESQRENSSFLSFTPGFP